MSGNEHFLKSIQQFLSHAANFPQWVFLILVICFVANPFAYGATKEAEDEKEEKVTKSSSQDDVKKTAQKPVADVTVIASRLPSDKEKLNDVPRNVTYKGKKELNATQPATFQEAIKDAEGIVLYDEVGNTFDATFSMRGFNSSSDVIFLVDGVRVNDVDNNTVKFPFIRMRNVESVQIDRGSSSAIYGSNAFAGVVNITTGQASEKPVHLFGGLEWTSFRGLRFNQGVSGTIGDAITPLRGKFKYYFNGERDSSKGFRSHNDFRLTSFDVKTSYELPDEQGKIYFNWKHIDDAINNTGEITFDQFQSGDLRRSNKPLDGWKFRDTIIQIGADKKFWDDRVTASMMGSQRSNRRNAFTTYGTFTDFVHGFDPYTNFVHTKARDRNLTWQVKYEDQWDKVANESLLGMEFRRARQLSLQRYGFEGHIQEDLPATTDRTAVYSNIGLFWRQTLKFWNRIIPYAGMRHDFHRVKIGDKITEDNISQLWRKSTVSTGVTIKPFKWMDVFGNFSQGFRVPTIDELTPYSGYTQSPLQPEKSNSYEVGTRFRYRNIAACKFSYFLIDVNNEIAWDQDNNENVNIGKSRRYGIEQRVDLMPFKEISLYGSYTWTQSYIREVDNNYNNTVDGRSLGLIPANRFTLGGNLYPLKRLGTPYDGLRIGMNGIFTGRQHPASYESTDQATLNATGGAGHWIKAYSVWDFILSFNWRGKEIYFKVNNIFDEKYYSRAVNATSWGTSIYPAGTYTFVNPGAGREFLLGAKWEFL